MGVWAGGRPFIRKGTYISFSSFLLHHLCFVVSKGMENHFHYQNVSFHNVLIFDSLQHIFVLFGFSPNISGCVSFCVV